MKKCCVFLCLLLISMMLSSCTYADFENKLKKEIMPGNDDKVDMNEFDQQAKPDENTSLNKSEMKLSSMTVLPNCPIPSPK